MADESTKNLSQKTISIVDGGKTSAGGVPSRMRMRKQSYGFGGVLGVRPSERVSQVAIEFKRPPLLFLPTFQLDSRHKFHRQEVMKIINSVLDEHWNGHKYNPTTSPALALSLSGEIMRTIKRLNYNRYRIIAVVTLGQKRAQSYNNAISFIWDYERDTYVDTNREEHTAFVQVTVFGIYLD